MHGSAARAYAAREVASATTRAAAAMTPERLRGTVGIKSGIRVFAVRALCERTSIGHSLLGWRSACCWYRLAQATAGKGVRPLA